MANEYKVRKGKIVDQDDEVLTCEICQQPILPRERAIETCSGQFFPGEFGIATFWLERVATFWLDSNVAESYIHEKCLPVKNKQGYQINGETYVPTGKE